MGRLVASRSRDLGISAIKEMSIRSAQIPDAASLACLALVSSAQFPRPDRMGCPWY